MIVAEGGKQPVALRTRGGLFFGRNVNHTGNLQTKQHEKASKVHSLERGWEIPNWGIVLSLPSQICIAALQDSILFIAWNNFK